MAVMIEDCACRWNVEVEEGSLEEFKGVAELLFGASEGVEYRLEPAGCGRLRMEVGEPWWTGCQPNSFDMRMLEFIGVCAPGSFVEVMCPDNGYSMGRFENVGGEAAERWMDSANPFEAEERRGTDAAVVTVYDDGREPDTGIHVFRCAPQRSAEELLAELREVARAASHGETRFDWSGFFDEIYDEEDAGGGEIIEALASRGIETAPVPPLDFVTVWGDVELEA